MEDRDWLSGALWLSVNVSGTVFRILRFHHPSLSPVLIPPVILIFWGMAALRSLAAKHAKVPATKFNTTQPIVPINIAHLLFKMMLRRNKKPTQLNTASVLQLRRLTPQ